MANSLTGDSRAENKPNDAFAQVPVPTFDPVTPGGRRARLALLVTSLVTLACLAAAITSEHYLKPWRIYQRQYGELLAARARAEGKKPHRFPQEIKQITSFTYGVADRCVTCHLGTDDPTMEKEEQPFRSHPAWVLDIHPAEKFGCTPCHGGQGLATTVEDAHGHVPHWDDPLIPPDYYQAGCGSCHTHLKVSGGSLADYGARLFERNDCFACHRVEGRGRGNGPDLSGIGVKIVRADWHRQHLALQKRSTDATWWESYGPLEADEILAINTYLAQLVRAPELAKAKATAYSKGCLGCHNINGVGGDDGPDLSDAGKKIPARLDFSNVGGPHNLAGWHKAHLLAPANITADSQMPQPALNEDELEAVTLYLLSLRGAESPMSRWPADRLEAARLGAREFATDGESLFKAFCSACHGVDGMGARFGISLQAFPAVAHPEFLAVASDRFIRQTLLDGRPGRRMPAWGAKEGGLRAEEVDEVIAYLRSRKPSPPLLEEVSATMPDLALGARLYRRDCAICHGADGEGASGPALSNKVFLRTVEPGYIYHMLAEGREDTAMGSYGHYDALETASVIAYIKSWRSGKALSSPALPSERSARKGREVYAVQCSRCHGKRGEGNLASNLVNPALLAAASDGFMATAVRRGRCVPPPGSPPDVQVPEVTDQELADAIEYIRTRAARGAHMPPGRTARGHAPMGETLFSAMCTGCHGKNGQGGAAPELVNPAFLSAATDGYLQASIVRGRPSAGMPAFGADNVGYRRLSAKEVDDIVRYIRTLKSDT